LVAAGDGPAIIDFFKAITRRPGWIAGTLRLVVASSGCDNVKKNAWQSALQPFWNDFNVDKVLPDPVGASSKRALICGGIYAVAYLGLASVLRTHFGFPLDDSWIHQVIARNLVETHVLGFTPGRLSSGSTSPLWTLILVTGELLLPRLSPVLFCVCASVLMFGALGFVLEKLTEEDGLSGNGAWSLALAPAACGNFLWFGLIGMEHVLFLLLSIGVVRVWFAAPSQRSRWNRVLLVLLSFLLVLTRPEGIFLIALLLLARRVAQRTLQDWWLAAAGAGGGGMVTAAISWIVSGRLSPQTMQGRQFLSGLNPGLKARLYFLGQTFARLLKNWTLFSSDRLLHGRALLLGVPLFLFVVLVLVIAVRGLIALQANRWMLLCAWAGVIELLYFVMLPATGHGGRYISVTLTVVFSLLLFGIYRILMALKVNGRTATFLLAALILFSGTESIVTWRRAAAADIDQINTEHAVMGMWLQQDLPPDSFGGQTRAGSDVAVFDIGRIGYQVRGNLIDLGGLVDSQYMPFLIQRRTAVYLQQHGVRYVVLPTDPESGTHFFSRSLALDPAHGVSLQPMHTVCAKAETVRFAFASSSAAFPCQSLYRIRYQGQPAVK
jgi:hypothetical protein